MSCLTAVMQTRHACVQADFLFMPDSGVKKKDCEADTDYQDKEETLMKNAGVLAMILGNFHRQEYDVQSHLELCAKYHNII